LNHRTPLTDEVYWPLVDHLGSVRDVAVCAGGTTSVSNHLVYSAFGQVLDETPGGVQLPFAFTGRELDRETDQYYYRARYYDAAAGKFLSEDPVGFRLPSRRREPLAVCAKRSNHRDGPQRAGGTLPIPESGSRARLSGCFEVWQHYLLPFTPTSADGSHLVLWRQCRARA